MVAQNQRTPRICGLLDFFTEVYFIAPGWRRGLRLR